jgi:pSer/pThr/pTyr-binding forkhead associated (FHA) protein
MNHFSVLLLHHYRNVVVKIKSKKCREAKVMEETKYKLEIKNGIEVGKVFDLRKKGNLVGRASHCDIVIKQEDCMGRKHFDLCWDDDIQSFVLIDYLATNGTFVNGIKVQDKVLIDGSQFKKISLANNDIITVGSTSFLFYLSGF